MLLEVEIMISLFFVRVVKFRMNLLMLVCLEFIFGFIFIIVFRFNLLNFFIVFIFRSRFIFCDKGFMLVVIFGLFCLLLIRIVKSLILILLLIMFDKIWKSFFFKCFLLYFRISTDCLDL